MRIAHLYHTGAPDAGVRSARGRLVGAFLVIAALAAGPARADEQTFDTGSLIIPLDLSYQSKGIYQAYGLLYELRRQGVPVEWVIDPDKTWHLAACNKAGDLCAWDCSEEGGPADKCTYPTASPDFMADRW